MALKWDDKYSVGLEIIDSRHKRLIRMVNEMDDDVNLLSGIDSLTDPYKKTRIYTCIMNLRGFFPAHFGTEERYLIRMGYQDFLEHKTEHDRFIMKVLELEQNLLAGQLNVFKEMCDFLRGWAAHRFTKVDQQYASQLKGYLRDMEKEAGDSEASSRKEDFPSKA